MARKFRKIDPRFWWDEKIVRLSTAEKCIALYVLTAPASNRIGMYRLSISAAADDLRGRLEEAKQPRQYHDDEPPLPDDGELFAGSTQGAPPR